MLNNIIIRVATLTILTCLVLRFCFVTKLYQINNNFCHHKKNTIKVILQYLFNVFILFNIVSYIKGFDMVRKRNEIRKSQKKLKKRTKVRISQVKMGVFEKSQETQQNLKNI